MRICAVIKYPPIQGGVSAQGYWLARGLAARGHEVDVVTNAFEVEDIFRLRLTADDRPWLTPSFEGGGRVRLHTPEVFSPKLTHIPQANPFVSKLAGLATWVVREHDSEVIFSYYLEPNGVAAHLASVWTGRPHVVQHAGSDLGRLMKQPGLDTTYLEVFRRADGVCTGSAYTFLGMGVPAEHLYRHPPFYLPREVFSPDAEPLDLTPYAAEVEAREPAAVHNPGPLDPALPTVGIYGKMGEVKGSFDLLAALGRLRREGRRFNFVAVTRGRGMERYLETLREQGLETCSWVLPFMAHWRIPGFLRACDAVCFLERDFPITFHAPTIPREVLSCGTCLILSGEIYDKQPYRDRMVDGESFLLVPDPKDHDALAGALARVLDDPAAAREIGRRGAEVLAERPDHDVHAEAYERMFEDVLDRRSGKPSRLEAADRGLAEDRSGALRRLAAPLLEALGDDADAALEAHMAAHREPASPHADARAMCADWRGRPARDDAGLRRRDAAHYAELLLWMSSLDDGADPTPRFDAADRLPERSGGTWDQQVLRSLAPLASRWVRVVRFDHLSSEGGQTLVFHKLPSLTGHHFRVNRSTAAVLEACDGRRTVTQLLDHFASADRPSRETARTLGAILLRFYREGLIVFVDPAEG